MKEINFRKKRIFFLLKSIVFLNLLFFMIYVVNRTLTPKYRYDTTHPLTDSYRGFYQMTPHSIDLLFLGSSQTGAAFNPQDLYNSFGIRGYNLASNSQSIWASYYWLKEALQYQSPQIVILDCYELYRDCRTDESNTRLAFDDMKWGAVKWEAARTVCNFDDKQSLLSYFLTNLRYHTRWSGLNETDFGWNEVANPSQLKGFWLYREKCGYQEYKPLEKKESKREPFLIDAKEYLDKIAKLCKENNIELILVKTPTLSQTIERHNAIMDYAEEQGLPFYDFNEKSLYEEINFDYGQDMHNSSNSGNRNAHANPSGARKMTNFIGKELANEYGMSPQMDSQWEETRNFGEGIWKDFQLRNETDLSSYLSMLKDERYTVFFSIKGDAQAHLSEKCQKQLQNLGLKATWKEESYQKSYYAIVENNQVITEKIGNKRLEKLGSFRNHEVVYRIISAGSNCGNECSIQINQKEQAKQKQGINIVVYNQELKSIIDSVCFDTHDPELTVSR